jgi:hypothetical protein
MSAGELQVWSWLASGWESRSFLVRFLYEFSASLMISWKLFDEEAVG